MKIPKVKLLKKNSSVEFSRIFLIQIIESGFGFAEEIRKAFVDQQIEIDKLSNTQVQFYLKDICDELPTSFLYFEQNENETHPELFTNLVSSSFDQGGLLILEKFGMQIYYLYTFDGQKVAGPCHDLHLSVNGKYMMRSSENKPGFHVYRFLVQSMKSTHLMMYDDLDSRVSDFLIIHNRDRVVFNLEKKCYESVESYKLPKNRRDVIEILSNQKTNYYCSPSLRDFYSKDKELAILAIINEPLTYTLLLEDILHDFDVINTLVLRTNVCLTPYFLNYQIDPSEFISELKIIELIKVKRLHFHALNSTEKQASQILFAAIEFDEFFPEIKDLSFVYKNDEKLMLELKSSKNKFTEKSKYKIDDDLPF